MSPVDRFTLIATTYQNISNETKIFSNYQLTNTLCVHAKSVSNRYAPVDVRQSGSESKDSPDILPNSKWDAVHKWLDIPITALDTSVGTHLYRIILVDLCNPSHTDVGCMYFQYTIVSNDIDKPYIYMNRDGGCDCE